MRHEHVASPLAFVMVGLPARGKSFLARRLLRYMSWLGYRTRVFNVGAYRRRLLGGIQGPYFFSPNNPDGVRLRKRMAEAAIEDTEAWLQGEGEVAIYDATNTTKSRRQWLRQRLEALGSRVVFVESMTDDSKFIESNVVDKHENSPDYDDVPVAEAIADLRARLAHYETIYEPVDDTDLSYIKLVDAGRQVICNRIEGYLTSQAASFLMNQHLVRRPILLTRHGQSVFNAEGRIGGDTALTDQGEAYGRSLRTFLLRRFPEGFEDLLVWTSTLRRTRQTAHAAGLESAEWGILDEIEAGRCNGMTYEEIRRLHPEEYGARQEDKLRYRYPRGESYLDLIERLNPIIVELERQRQPVLVIAHQAVLRVLYAYFMHEPLEDCPYLPMPLQTVVELSPTSTGCDEHRHELTLDP